MYSQHVMCRLLPMTSRQFNNHWVVKMIYKKLYLIKPKTVEHMTSHHDQFLRQPNKPLLTFNPRKRFYKLPNFYKLKPDIKCL